MTPECPKESALRKIWENFPGRAKSSGKNPKVKMEISFTFLKKEKKVYVADLKEQGEK